MSSLAPVLRQKFFSTAGLPLAGGKLFSYVAGSSTPLATYTDVTGITANTNPVILDANGEAEVWLGSASYKFVLEDSLNNVQWTVDSVSAASGGGGGGGLSPSNNLSDLTSVPAALFNLGISPYTYRTTFPFTNGQSATNLTGEAFNGTAYNAVIYEFLIAQGTTIMASGDFSLHYKNSTWLLVLGESRGDNHGITFSVTQSVSTAQVQAAEGGLGNGTLYLKKHYFNV